MLLLRKYKSIIPIVSSRSVTNAAVKEYIDPELETAKPFKEIPTQSFFTRDFLPKGALYGKPMEEWNAYFQKKHGNIFKFPGILGKPDIIMVFDPEDVKKVYRLEGQWPNRIGLDTWIYWRNQNKDLFKNFYGLVLQQGETWQKYRTILNPVMMQPKVVSLYVPEIDAVTRDFIELTKKSLDENNETPADYGNYIQRFTLEAIATVAIETRLNILEPKEGNKGTELTKLVDELFNLTFQLDSMPSIWKYYKTKKFYRIMEVMDRSTEIIKGYIDAAIESFEKEGSQKPEELQGVLYKLLKIDKEVAIIMALDMMSVGIDTTASNIKSLLYLLASNPEKQKVLREEIMQILPSKTDSLTVENMKHMPYLRACMKEANRVLPTVQGNARKLPYDIALQGYRIPKGLDIILLHPNISLQEDQFPRPHEFIPERWLKDESHAEAVGCPHSKTAHKFSFMPFGHGTRACIGKRFAELETSVLAARMIREFDVSWHYPKPKIVSHTVRSLGGDLKLRLKSI